MAQQVKDPALSFTAAQVTAVAQVQSWPGNFHVLWTQSEKKRERPGVPVVAQW